jgi:hypothetical protein
MAIDSLALRMSFSFTLCFTQTVVFLVVIQHLLCLWEVDSLLPCHIIVIISFPLDVLFVVTLDSRCLLIWDNQLNNVWTLNCTRLFPYCSFGGRWWHFSCRNCEEFFSKLTFTISWNVISVGNSNTTAFGPRNLMTWNGPAHGCCNIWGERFWLGYVIGWMLVFNITLSPIWSVCGLRLLFASAVWQTFSLQRRSWVSSSQAWNLSKNAAHLKLNFSSCCVGPATTPNGIDGVYPTSDWNGLQSVDECVDVLYAYSASGSMVFHWSWWWVAKTCAYRMTCFSRAPIACLCVGETPLTWAA